MTMKASAISAVKPSFPMSRRREKGKNTTICMMMSHVMGMSVLQSVTARMKAFRFSEVKTM